MGSHRVCQCSPPLEEYFPGGKERRNIMKKQWQEHRDKAAPGSALSTSLKPTVTAKTDGHFSS